MWEEGRTSKGVEGETKEGERGGTLTDIGQTVQKRWKDLCGQEREKMGRADSKNFFSLISPTDIIRTVNITNTIIILTRTILRWG